MIYVMECGPVHHRGREGWLVFALDLKDDQAKVRVTPRRKDARWEMVRALAGAPASCCASLSDFGRAQGWRVASVPERVLKLAAQTVVGLENEEALGMVAYSPIADAWLRASTAFFETAPWKSFSIREPLTVTFTKATHDTRVLAAGGSGGLPPSLIMLPNLASYSRFSASAEPDFDDAFIMGFGDHASTMRDVVGLAYGACFHPIVVRVRQSRPSLVSPDELLHLACALAATASLTTGRPVGRAVIDGLEAIVLPLTPEAALRS